MTVALLVVVLAVVVFLNDLGDFNTDIKPEVYIAPLDMIGRYLSSWTSSPYLGSPNFNVGLVPVLLILAALRGIGLSPEMAFKTFHLLLWLAAAWGAVRLVRALVPRAGRWAGLVAGVVYLANPYTVQAGATLAIALPLSLLPWQLLCYVRALRDDRSWAWPAAFGLTFFAMSGMNVAVVPLLQLLAMVPVALAIRSERSLPWRRVLAVTAKCALFVLGVSVYWLIPSAAASSTGSQIVESSETLTGIAKVSSFPEVLRGVGLWPLYGYDDKGPWLPQHATYVASPFVIVMTMAWPVLALLMLRWCTGVVRRMVAVSIGVAAVIMVGIFPRQGGPASPFGWVLEHILRIPLMSAFRTTNKIGAVLALALAVAIGVGVVRFLPRVWRRPGVAPVAVALAVALLASWALPAFGGRLYVSKMNIPGYWTQAAERADAGNPASTVLMLPGQVRPDYRWTVERPDDVANSLLKRDAVIPETTPNASRPGANFLAALNDAVQSGAAPAGTVATFARYLGSDQVLLRRDMVWEDDGGARPSVTTRMLQGDLGLKQTATFGYPSENVGQFSDPQGQGEEKLTPLALYDVAQSRTAVRAQAATGGVIVAGDGFAFPSMTAAGTLGASPTVRYAQDLSAAELAQVLPTTGRMVITDTNARRDVIPNRLIAGQGPLLSGTEKLGDTRTLGDRTADQTVLLRSGAIVRASTSGGTFFDLPYGVPEFAVDGDPRSAWRFGDFRRATGQTLQVRLPAPTSVGRVPVSQLPIGSVKIDKVTLTGGGRSSTVRLPDKGSATLDLGGAVTDRVTLRIDSIRGEGFSLVGLAELGLPGAKAARTARTPTTFSDQYARMTPQQRARMDAVPMDILLRRVLNSPDDSDDSERALRRVVTVPSTRDYTAEATVRVTGPLERTYDDAAGYAQSVRADSSAFYFTNPRWRASQAADGDPSTAWAPGGSIRGEHWQVTGPERNISDVTLDQVAGSASSPMWVSRVQISVDGRTVLTTGVRPGKNTLRLPEPVQGRTVRVTITGLSGRLDASPPRFTEIDAGVRMQTTTPGPLDRSGRERCLTVATVDGKPLKMRPVTPLLAGPDESGTRWVACQDVTLESGERRIEQTQGFVLDTMDLKDKRPTTQQVPLPPTAQVVRNSSSAKTLKVTAGDAPYAVVIGQSIDPRWKATADGQDLGAPVTLDGFSAGWVLPKGGSHTIQIRFAPQRTSNIALGVSVAVVLLAAALVLLASWRRRRVGARLDDPDRTASAARRVRAASDGEPGSRRAVRARARHVRDDRPGWPRWTREIGLIALAWFAVGWAGLAAGLLVVLVLRRWAVRPMWLIGAGAGLLMTSIVVYIALLGDQRGTVSADAVASSMLPHHLCGAGLVIALVGVLLPQDHHHDDPDEDMTETLTLEAARP
ncbi:alpha-(1-_3)-arabinofuranosyltransferase domain-containing protein [Luteipulveratus flavus]|uniref:Alpha-(1->3)-arabinofuranosyltransferase family protein n=1 Tax=Luteipulveratus flavus TaxID=3031728 RepID=A0ABT6C5I3_9MICO|nr:alpha-(1->3)-arabinofuranosyltransferase family protein [Luteipulveratus sp. YIM 133296]MDF8264090.1 alpha-(1->3)-arabinofuranosyltransferase family protein [Luteipulveratus sp. YIM 133296]